MKKINTKQKILIRRLYELFLEINEEAINDDNFNEWLSQNYFLEKDLEEVIVQIKNILE